MSEILFHAFQQLIEVSGYPGVFVLMAIQSMCIPIPSEVIMPMAGWVLDPARGQWPLIVLATLGSIGANVGSIPAYWLGAKGGRPMIERYGRYILLSGRDLDIAEKFFGKYGSITVLIGRLLPIVRTFIALPAGMAKMNLVRFHVYTFVGSWPWCYALAWVGMKMGATFSTDPRFKQFFDRFHHGVEAVIVLAFVYFVVSHWKHRVGAETVR